MLRFNSMKIYTEGLYSVKLSIFIDLHLDESYSAGSCIHCNEINSILMIDSSQFLMSSSVYTGGAVCVDGCKSVTVRNSCFAKNKATFSPDIYLHNRINTVSSFKLLRLSMIRSNANSHFLAIGSESSSLENRYLNQSYLSTGSLEWSIWVFIYNQKVLNLKYVISFENIHKNLFSHHWSSTNSVVNIQNFCSVNDSIDSFFFLNSGKSFNFEESIFILKKSISVENIGNVEFGAGCFSNIFLHSSLATSPGLTFGKNKYDRCLANEISHEHMNLSPKICVFIHIYFVWT